jgi:hypothetical protein
MPRCLFKCIEYCGPRILLCWRIQAVFHLTAEADKTRVEVERMREVEEPVEKINAFVRTEFLATLDKELTIATVSLP